MTQLQHDATDQEHAPPVETLKEGPLRYPFLAFAAACALTVVVYFDSLRPLLEDWLQFDQSLGHALALFVLICGWMASLHGRFDALARAPSLRGALLVAAVSLAWLLAALGDIGLVEQLIVIAMFFALAVMTGGWRAALVVAPPIAMLLFCVPIWDELNDQLVDLSAVVVGWYVSASSITAYLSGNAIFLPEGTVVIAGGCSGLRYLIVGLAIANLAAAMNRLPLRHHLTANVLAIGIMLALNWVRIGAIVTIAYLSHMENPLVRDHEDFGWVLFGVAMLPLLLYVRQAPQRPEAG